MRDVLIIGGGPAGLSAALVLGRCRRDVQVIDAGQGRNRHAREIHGYLTRDCTTPADFLSKARDEVERYGVAITQGEAIHAESLQDGTFTVRYRSTGANAAVVTARARKLLLATGMRDEIPAIEGIDTFYGKSVHHCPYCDGYEHSDRRLVAYGQGDAAVGLALALHTWSRTVTACTDGVPVRKELIDRAALAKIAIRPERVRRLAGKGAQLTYVEFHEGQPLPADALFFNTRQTQRSKLPRLLGCSFKDDGGVQTNDRQCAGVRGLYVAGDADREVEFVIVAAAQGATAATAINGELQREATGG
jgi:thioredoxin reductase